ncbi:hypothetical protein BC826DRAFT_1090192 [Russula brevipes]|nr:hypothetical protein BC826DRAFT_1090192 [Russula brevipes]
MSSVEHLGIGSMHPDDDDPTSSSPTHADLRGGTLSVRADGEDHYSYTYAYGPAGLAGLRGNTYALRCAVFASLGGLTFGYDQGVIANVLVMEDFVARWPIGAWERGLMTAVLELGCLFGALGAGVLADRVSRRTAIASACAVFCIGSALQTWAQSLTQITGGRAIGGLGISPPEVRGSLLALEQFSIVLGCVVGFWTGFLTRSVAGSLSWRIPLGLQLLPGILLGLGTFALPASPRLLVLRGRREEALASLAKLRLRPYTQGLLYLSDVLQIELMEMEAEATMLQRASPIDRRRPLRSEALAWAKLFDRRYIDRTLVGVLVMFFQQWSGINALIYYGPFLMRSLGFNGSTINLLVAGGINIVQFLAVFPAIYTSTVGPLLRGGSACVYLFTVAYGVSFGPVGWVLPNEVFPLSMRGKGAALSTASNWLNNFLIGLITPPLMENSPAATFGVFGTACFLAYLWATHVVPETANVSLEMIDELFRSPENQGDILVKRQVERDLGLHDLMRGLTEPSET